MTTKIATFIKELPNTKAHQELYRVSPPLKDRWSDDEDATAYEYVVASSVTMAFDHGGPETLVFPAREDGSIVNHLDLLGQRGTTSAEKVFKDEGYEVCRV